MQNVTPVLALIVFSWWATGIAGAITPLSDEDLSSTSGEGIGLVLQSYQLSTDATSSWRVGIEGNAGELVFQDFWWMPSGNVDTPSGGSGCASGTRSVAVSANTGGTGATTNRCVSAQLSLPRTGGAGATLGRVSDPIRFDVTNRTTNENSPGDPISNALNSAGAATSRTVMSLAAMKSSLAADRMDASYLMTLDHCALNPSTCPLSAATFPTAPTTRNVRYDVTRITTRGMDIDGSSIAMWAEGNRLNYVGQINFRADDVNFVLNEDPAKPKTTDAGYGYVYETTPGTAFGNFRIGPCLNNSYCDNQTSLTNFRSGARGATTAAAGTPTTGGGVEFYYPIGRGFYQPVTISTEADGNLTIELKLLPSVANVYGDFYEDKAWDDNGNNNAEGSYNTPRGYVRLGSLTTNWDGKATVPNFTACSTGTNGAIINCNGLNQWQRENYSYSCGWFCTTTGARYNPVGPRRDFGYSRIEGIQIQYLKITTKGL